MTKTSKHIITAAILALTAGVWQVQALDLAVIKDDALRLWDNTNTGYLTDRLQLGLRFSYFTLDDSKEENFDENGEFTGGFLGSINELKEKQRTMPTLFARYIFSKYLAASLGWEHLEVETRTYFDTTDGDFIYAGPAAQIEGRYPNESVATPYASLGLALLYGDVDYNPEWHQNGRRNFYTDNTTAFLLSFGTEVAITEQFIADIFLRHMSADFDVEYKLAAEANSRGTFNFPLGNWAFGLTAIYAF